MLLEPQVSLQPGLVGATSLANTTSRFSVCVASACHNLLNPYFERLVEVLFQFVRMPLNQERMMLQSQAVGKNEITVVCANSLVGCKVLGYIDKLRLTFP